MTALSRFFALVGLCLLAVLLLTRWQLASAQKTLEQQSRILSQQKDTLLAQSAAIGTLQDSARRNEQAQIQLRAKLTQANQLATARDQQLTRLLNENADLRRWFGAALPDDIKRLHQRPAFDSPGDYLRWLSEGGKLPDTGQQPANQWRSE